MLQIAFVLCCQAGSARGVLRSQLDRVRSDSRPESQRPHERNAMRNTVLARMIATLATPAYAQFAPNLAGPGKIGPKTDVEVRQEKEREAGYRAGIGQIPDAK